MSDQLKTILDAAPTSNRVRAAAWDVFYQSSDEQSFKTALDQLPLSTDTKAALWDVKFAAPKPAVPAPMTPMPSHQTPPLQTPRGVNSMAFGPGAIPPSVDVRPVADAYVKHGPQAIAEGVQDIGQGNFARGGRQVLSGAAVTTAPITAPAIGLAAVTAPLATAAGIGTGIAAKEGVEFGARHLGATEDQAGLAGDIAGIASGGAAAKFGPGAVKAAQQALPTRANAGAKFQKVMGAVGDEPVDISRPGDAALRVMQLSERGGTMPKAVRDFLRRATDPEKGEPTYREMRDFYSNISRLSADEMKRLTPVVRKQVGELRAALDESLAAVAAKGGQERVYRSAMREYAVASRIRELAEKTAKYGAGVAGAGAAYNMLKN